jgi:hypothetical protein
MCRGWRKVWGRQLAGGNDGDGGVVAGGGRTAGTVLAPGSLNVPEGSGCPGMGGRRLAGGGRPGVSGKGSLGTSAPLFHIASKRAPQGPGSRHGSGRGRRTSNTRTRAGEVVLPGGRVHTGCLLPTPRTPPRRKRLRACPVLEFGLERCPRLWCGCWSWFPGAPRWGFWLAGLVGGGRLGCRAGVRTVHSGEGDVHFVHHRPLQVQRMVHGVGCAGRRRYLWADGRRR